MCAKFPFLLSLVHCLKQTGLAMYSNQTTAQSPSSPTSHLGCSPLSPELQSLSLPLTWAAVPFPTSHLGCSPLSLPLTWAAVFYLPPGLQSPFPTSHLGCSPLSLPLTWAAVFYLSPELQQCCCTLLCKYSEEMLTKPNLTVGTICIFNQRQKVNVHLIRD